MVRKFFLKYRWHISLLLLFPWFFIGGSDDESSRLMKETWNLGHIVFFGVFALAAMRCLQVSHLAIRTKCIITIVLVLGTGITIEACQSLIAGRDSSFLDIIYDLVGGFAVLVWKYSEPLTLRGKIPIYTIASGCIVICMMPFLLTVVDEYRSRRDFPVLSDFESFLDVSRWGGNGRVARVNKPVKSGSFSLKVLLTTEKYSGISLKYFPQNWSGAKALVFSVYNPGEPVTLSFRVHDRQHLKTGQDYLDRYNGRVILDSGWNTVTIRMEHIENAPKTRKIDIAHIRGFELFVAQQPVERILYVDDVKLLMDGQDNNL